MQLRHDPDGSVTHHGCLCSFGISEALGITALFDSIGGAIAGTGIGTDLGLTAAGVGSTLEGATVGAGIGAAGAGITGGNPLTGALTGGLTGGVVGGLGSTVGADLGIGTVGGDALVGAGAGAVGAGLTGSNPLTGALTGGAGGALSGAIGSASGGTGGAISGGPGASAAGSAAPAGVGLDTSPDVTLTGATDGVQPASGAAVSPVSDNPGGGANPDGSLPTPPQPPDTVPPVPTAPPGYTVTPATGAAAQPLGTGTFGPTQNYSGVSRLIGASPSATTVESAPTDTGFANITNTGISAPTTSNVLGGATSTGLGLGSPAQGANAQGVLGAINGFLGTNLSAGNLATLGLGTAALGYDALKGAQTPKGLNAINSEATNLNNQATQLESYLQNGTLPPGVQTSLNQAAAAAQATIRSQYASRGMSGSSAEAQDLANVQNTIASQGASIAQSLLTTGVQESGLAAQLYEQILNQSLQSDQQLGTALTTLASAGARPTVQIGGTTSG